MPPHWSTLRKLDIYKTDCHEMSKRGWSPLFLLIPWVVPPVGSHYFVAVKVGRDIPGIRTQPKISYDFVKPLIFHMVSLTEWNISSLDGLMQNDTQTWMVHQQCYPNNQGDPLAFSLVPTRHLLKECLSDSSMYFHELWCTHSLPLQSSEFKSSTAIRQIRYF